MDGVKRRDDAAGESAALSLTKTEPEREVTTMADNQHTLATPEIQATTPLESPSAADCGAHRESDLDRLRASVEEMDRLSQDGFSQIALLARLTLAAAKSPDSNRHHAVITQALQAIWEKAEDVENCVNCVAEAAGCNYDPASDEARRAARGAWLATDMRVSA